MLTLLRKLKEKIEENQAIGVELSNDALLEILAELIKEEEDRLDF